VDILWMIQVAFRACQMQQCSQPSDSLNCPGQRTTMAPISTHSSAAVRLVYAMVLPLLTSS
jgi:hypothetical protein